MNQPLRLDRKCTITSTGGRAIDVLAGIAPELSRQQIKKAMLCGAVWLTQGKHTRRLRRVTQALKQGDILEICFDATILAKAIPEPRLLADEKTYSVWYKPKGLLAQGSRYGDHCSLLFQAESRLVPHRPCYLIHRLDGGADGIMLLAHNERAAAALSRLFQERTITKHYHALVHGILPADMDRIDTAIDGKAAITHIHNAEPGEREQQTSVGVSIDTGRKHQIRRHFASIGHPVVGDRKYGDPGDPAQLQLTAYSLAFTCPLTRRKRHYTLDNPEPG